MQFFKHDINFINNILYTRKSFPRKKVGEVILSIFRLELLKKSQDLAIFNCAILPKHTHRNKYVKIQRLNV